MSDLNVEPTISLVPGKECPTCKRRVSYPPKETSPDTRSITLRVPVDEADAFEEIFEAAARHIGAHSNPHWRYRAALWGLALALQSAGVEEYTGVSAEETAREI